jgi:hypothetical protein
MKQLYCTIALMTTWVTCAFADYACMLEERPVCRQHLDPKNDDREKHQAACLKQPGRPVNKCPERAFFSCKLEGGEITEFTYRNEDKLEAQKSCAAKRGKFEIRP